MIWGEFCISCEQQVLGTHLAMYAPSKKQKRSFFPTIKPTIALNQYKHNVTFSGIAEASKIPAICMLPQIWDKLWACTSESRSVVHIWYRSMLIGDLLEALGPFYAEYLLAEYAINMLLV